MKLDAELKPLDYTGASLSLNVRIEPPIAEGLNEADRRELLSNILKEACEAANVLVAHGFKEPYGRDNLGTHALSIARWNLQYASAAEDWIKAGDLDSQSLGVIPRAASRVLRTVATIIGYAALEPKNSSRLGLAATALNLGIQLGLQKAVLRDWLDGNPQKRVDMKLRGKTLKSAEWFTPNVSELIDARLAEGVKQAAITSEVAFMIGADTADTEKIRVKIQREAKKRTTTRCS